LFVTTTRTGSSWPGRLLQRRQLSKSPSAVPASPLTVMLSPSPPCRFCISAEPGAMTHWTSITLVTGTTFHSGMA
jgi:hypothetical protein